MASPPKPPRALTTVEMLVSATGLTLLMLILIEAVFLVWSSPEPRERVAIAGTPITRVL